MSVICLGTTRLPHLSNLTTNRDSHDDELAVPPGPEDPPELVALGRDLGNVPEDRDRLRGVSVRLPLRHFGGKNSGGYAEVSCGGWGIVARGGLKNGRGETQHNYGVGGTVLDFARS